MISMLDAWMWQALSPGSHETRGPTAKLPMHPHRTFHRLIIGSCRSTRYEYQVPSQPSRQSTVYNCSRYSPQSESSSPPTIHHPIPSAQPRPLDPSNTSTPYRTISSSQPSILKHRLRPFSLPHTLKPSEDIAFNCRCTVNSILVSAC